LRAGEGIGLLLDGHAIRAAIAGAVRPLTPGLSRTADEPPVPVKANSAIACTASDT